MTDQEPQPDDAFVPPGMTFVWQGFWHLHPDRPMVSEGLALPLGATFIDRRPLPIPFASVDRYAERFGIAGETFDLFRTLIDALDRVYLDWEADRYADVQRQRAAAQSS